MKRPNFRLSTRITIAAVALVVAGAMALVFIEEARLRDIYLSEQRANLGQALHAEKIRLSQTINTLREDVLFLSTTPPISGIVRAALNRGYDARDGDTRERWEARLQKTFAAFSKAHPNYYKIRFIGVADGGREIVRTDNRSGIIEITPSDRLQAKGDRDYFKAGSNLREGQVYLSELNLNQEFGVIEQPYWPTLRAVTPVFTPAGEIFGMVLISIDANSLLKASVLSFPQNVRTYIANSDGQYLLHPDARRAFTFELGSKDKITTDFPLLETMFKPRAPEHFPLQAIAAKAGAQYLAAERIHFDPGNPARFLMLAYHIPDDMAARQIFRIPARHIAGGLIAMLLVSGIALLVLRRTFAPLERITGAAREITAGNRQIRLAETGGGEIGELAHALNSMLDRLSDSDLIERENAFRKSIIETAHDGFWLVDAQGNLLDANQAYADISGYTVKELVGMHISQLEAKEQSIDEVKAHIARIIAAGYDVFETRHRRKDGHEIDVEVSTTFMRDTQKFVAFCRDVTARKQIEEAKLRESDERFRGTLEQAAVGIAHATPDGHFRQINQKFCNIVGYPRDELIRMRYQDITYPADLEENLHYMQQLLAGEISTFSMEKRYVRKDRSLVWANLTVSLLRDAGGNPKYTIVVIEDITGRKQSEALVQQFGSLLQHSFNEIYLFDVHDLRFLLASEGAERNLGYSFDELNQLTLLDLCPSFTMESFWQMIAPLRSGEKQSLFYETFHRRKDGTAYPVEARLQLMEPDSPVFMAVVQDITERRQAEMELNQSRKLLRELVVQSESMREEERKRIAREVHDELGQILTALRMKVALLRIEFGGHNDALLDKIKGINELLDQSIRCARDVVANLRPVALDMGIVPAIKWLRDEFIKHTGTLCVLYAPEEEIHLDELLAAAAFRVVQESLTNITRYAEASKVEIFLEQDADNFSVTVTDNGKGFDYMAISNHKSFGLLGMRERAFALGGAVNIYSAPQQGTQIFFVIPNKQTTTDTKGDNP